MSDIFRIYAPEAPFNEKELVQIFSVFFRQLLSVKDPAGPLFPYYFYLLETISTIKCVCLLGQLRSADDLISQLFRDFFEIIGYSVAFISILPFSLVLK
jgi:sister-chromatid-cohesion protein PDS5